jgi:histidine ammonia-lyase
MAAAQAFDFRAPVKPAPATQAAYNVVRKYVRTLEEDRPLFDDINTLARVIKEGELLEAVENLIGAPEENHVHDFAAISHAQ